MAGIFDFLGSLFGGSGGASAGGGGNYAGLISALGGLASRFQATPNAGASEADIRKANRINLLTGLLGGGAQAFGAYQQQQQKQNALAGLADIFRQGGMTTTVPGLPGTEPTQKKLGLSESLFELMKRNPQVSDTLLPLAVSSAQQEQKQMLDLAKIQAKQNAPLDWNTMSAMANTLEKQGYKGPEVEQKQLGIIAAMGRPAPIGFGGMSQPPSLGLPQPQMPSIIPPQVSQSAPQKPIESQTIEMAPRAPSVPSQTQKAPLTSQFPEGYLRPEEQNTLEELGVPSGPLAAKAIPTPTPSPMQMGAPEDARTARIRQQQSRELNEYDNRIINQVFKDPRVKDLKNKVETGDETFDVLMKQYERWKQTGFQPVDRQFFGKGIEQFMQPGLQVTQNEVAANLAKSDPYLRNIVGRTIQGLTGGDQIPEPEDVARALQWLAQYQDTRRQNIIPAINSTIERYTTSDPQARERILSNPGIYPKILGEKNYQKFLPKKAQASRPSPFTTRRGDVVDIVE